MKILPFDWDKEICQEGLDIGIEITGYHLYVGSIYIKYLENLNLIARNIINYWSHKKLNIIMASECFLKGKIDLDDFKFEIKVHFLAELQAKRDLLIS